MRFALLKVSVCALAISTWVFWSFIFATQPESSAPNALESLVRLPASLPRELPAMVPGMSAGPATRANDPIAMDVVTVPCWEKSATTSLTTNAHWIRLTGRACGLEWNGSGGGVGFAPGGAGVGAAGRANTSADVGVGSTPGGGVTAVAGAGRAGKKATLADSILVRNVTNGYVATIFSTQARKLTTDFIPLNSGHNEILIRIDRGEGVAPAESQLSFVRE